ncbi:MAG: hypothetical protein L0Y61_04015, partial [Epsilonproteobacteria bacterium]|nr:hypothetical protein [Campylobacterota bacterium]
MRIKNMLTVTALTVIFSGCATTSPEIINVEKPIVTKPNLSTIQEVEPTLKRKVAIARFGNEAQYGKSALFGLNSNYNAEKQATDI